MAAKTGTGREVGARYLGDVRRSLFIALLIPSLAILPRPAASQAALGAAVTAIRSAISSGDRDGAIRIADSLARRFPSHPSLVMLRAQALAVAGRLDDAERDVRRLLTWDARYARRALQDSLLAPLRPRLDSVVAARVERADVPVARGRAWAVLEERDLVPEGTAWDPATRSVLVGSLNKRTIVAIGPDGAVSDRVVRGSNGLTSVVGIHVDARRGVLWATSNARYDRANDSTRSALFAFDAATGRFRNRYEVPGPGRTFLNDLTTGPDGSVFITETNGGRIWALRPGAAALVPFTGAGELTAPNGITISADGRHLFVADLDHIQVAPLDGGPSWRLEAPDSVNLTGIDGLAFTAEGLIAHQALAYWRVARYELSPDRRRVTGRTIFEVNTADIRTSTTGEVVGDEYVYIGNSQIDRMNSNTIDSATMQPVRMYRVPIRPRQNGLVAVALSAIDSVAILDDVTLERVSTVATGKNPHEISAAPGGDIAYVADAQDSTISVIDVASSPRVTARWKLPRNIRVHDVEATTDGQRLLAVSGERQVALEIDARSGRVVRVDTVPRAGGWMIDAPGPGGAAVIANLEGGAVTLLSRGGVREFVGAEGEIDAAATPDLREVWSVNFRDGNLTVFDATSGRQLVRQLSGPGASRVVFLPNGRTALTVNGGDSTLVSWDVRSRTRLTTLKLPRSPKVIAVSSDGRRAYISHPGGGLTAVDVPAMTIMRTIALPGTPDGVAVLRDPRR